MEMARFVALKQIKQKSNLLVVPFLLVLFQRSVLIPRFNFCLFFSLPKQLPHAEGLK